VSESGSVEAPPRPVLEEINGWAFASEVVIHGKPSGLDNTTSCFGGAVFLNRETGRFQSMTSVPPVKILVTNTKVPRSTKVQVTAVRELRDRLPGVIQPVFEVMEQISQRFLALSEEFRTLTNNRPESGNLITLSNPPLVSDSDSTRGLGLVASTSLADIERGVSSSFKEGSNRSSNSGSGNGNGSSGSNRSSGSDPSAVSAFLTRAHAELSTLFTINHHQLVALGVSHSALDAVAAASGKLGMACKLTGAGGGGCAITLVPPQSPASATGTFIDEMEARGFECFGSAVGGSGVLWHN
jgi:mevalonate kinase